MVKQLKRISGIQIQAVTKNVLNRVKLWAFAGLFFGALFSLSSLAGELPDSRLQDAKLAIKAGDYLRAANIYETLAQQGNAKAQYNLGLMYFNGDGVKQDYQQAVQWYTRSAEQGYSEAQYNLGVIYFRKDIVAMDYEQAIKWYRLAATQGHARSQLNLGVIYFSGQVVPQDYAEAVKWYRLAAEQGYAEAQYNLGNMYFSGEGLPLDPVRGYMWVSLAIDNSTDGPTKNKRSRILNFSASKMTAEQIIQAKALAVKCSATQFKNCQ